MTPSTASHSPSREGFSLDVSRFPNVLVTLSGAMTLASARVVTESLQDKVFARGEPYTLVIDATFAGVPDAAARQHFAEFSKRNAALTKRYCRAEAYVLPSAVLRGALTAIMWFSPFEYPHKIFATVDEARAWVSQVTL